MLTLACFVAALTSLAVCCGISWILGWSANIHRRHKPCVAHGYRQGRMEGEAERDQLAEQLDEATADYAATLDQLVGIALERDEYRKAAEEMTVILAQMGAVIAHHGDVDGAYADAREVSS